MLATYTLVDAMKHMVHLVNMELVFFRLLVFGFGSRQEWTGQIEAKKIHGFINLSLHTQLKIKIKCDSKF